MNSGCCFAHLSPASGKKEMSALHQSFRFLRQGRTYIHDNVQRRLALLPLIRRRELDNCAAIKTKASTKPGREWGKGEQKHHKLSHCFEDVIFLG